MPGARFFHVPAKQNLRHRVTHALGLVLALTALFTIVAVVGFVYQTEKAAWQSRQLEAALGAGRTVENFVSQIRQYMALISFLNRDYLEANPQVIRDLLHQNQALLEIICLDGQGNIFASAHQDSAPVLANLFTISQSTWFLEAHQGRSYAGGVQISSTDEPYMILALPASDGGVVATRLRMDVLWDVVSGIQFGETGRAYVVDQNGHVIAHPNPDVVLKHTLIADRPEMISALQTPDNKWNGVYRNFENQHVVGMTMPIPGKGWMIFAEISRVEAFASTRQALVILGSSAILLGLLANWVTSRLLRRLVLEPVEKLRDGAERVGQGDLGYRLDSHRPDEIGQVAAEFNVMTARLQEREAALAQARDKALAASRFKSRLLANVSHDLRTPLNGIVGYADMLREGVYGSLTDRQIPATDRILTHAQRLLDMINSLLDQAQVEAGKIELRYSPFDPRDLMSELEAVASLLAQKKGLTLTTEIDPALPTTLIGDRQRLQQILMNLVGNALKFTDEGSVHVRFYPNTDRWSIEVSDTGRGIPTEAQPYIFDAFQQVDSSTTRESDGVGLGLSIVRELTSLMSGEIHLSSQIGGGSTFTVLLPLAPPGEKVL